MADIFYATTLLKIVRAPLQKVCAEVAQLPAVGLATPLTGRYDAIAFIRGEMGGALSDTIKVRIPAVKGIMDSETLVIMGEHNPLGAISASVHGISPDNTFAIVLIQVHAGKLIEVGNSTKSIDQVLFVGPTAGSYDLLALVATVGSKMLGKVIFAIQNNDAIKSTETCVLLDDVILHNWALDS